MKSNKHWHVLNLLLTDDEYKDRKEWCQKTIKENKWKARVQYQQSAPPPMGWMMLNHSYYSFKNKEDLVLFQMTWGYQ